MRVADNMLYEQVNSTLAKNRSEMVDLQNQAATLKRVTKPSDDPIAATRVLSFRTEQQSNSQFLKTANQAKSLLEFSDQSLGELTDVLIRAKELVLSQASDAGAGAETRKLVSSEVGQLYRQAVQIGNRKLGDKYLFGGYNTTQAPFDFDGNYRGDDGEMMLPINKDAMVAVNVPGSRVFMGKGTLDHEIGSQEIVDPQNIQEIRKAQVHSGQVKRADVDEFTAPPATDQQQEELKSVRGPASIAVPGEPEKPKAQEGFGLNAANVEGKNIFKLLKDIEISLKTNDKSALQDSIEDLDVAASQVVLARAAIGSRVMSLQANSEAIQRFDIDAKAAASVLEDADQFEVVSSINKAEGTLQATLQTSGKLIQPSLLDFLR